MTSLLMSHCRARDSTHTARRQVVGAAPSSCFLFSLHSFSMPHGRHCRDSTIASGRISRLLLAELFGTPDGWFGGTPKWMPVWVSAAMLILWAPGDFESPAITIAGHTTQHSRPTRHHVRWASREIRYLGERSFPLVVQNVHRYFLYLALVFLVILGRDVWDAFWFNGRFGIGIGTLVRAGKPRAVELVYIGLSLFAPSSRWLSRPTGRCPKPKEGL